MQQHCKSVRPSRGADRTSNAVRASPASSSRSACVWGGWLLSVLLTMAPGWAWGAAPDTVESLVERLGREAVGLPLPSREGDGPAPEFDWPHPSLGAADLTPALAEAAADRLMRMGGDDLAARYVRYHLVGLLGPAMSRVEPDETAETAETAEAAEAAGALVGAAAMKALAFDRPVRHLSESIERPWRWMPESLGSEYERLWRETVVTVGVPPFTRTVGGEQAIRLAPERASRIREAVRRRDALRRQIERIDVPGADERNRRRHRLNELVRRVRAEATELAIGHGRGRDVMALIETACDQAGRSQASGIDMLDAALRAIVTGRADLTRLETADARRIGARLRALAGRPGRWVRPEEGGNELDWRRSRRRNVAELAGGLAFYFDLPGLTSSFVRNAYMMTDTPVSPAPDGDRGEGELSLGAIERAIDAARPLVADPDGRDPLTEPIAIDLPPWPYRKVIGNNFRRDTRDKIARKPGTDAALAWALIATGQPSQSPGLQVRTHSSLAVDTDLTFNRAMRATLASHLPRSIFEPLFRREIAALIEGMSDRGGWGERLSEDAGWGDHAHAQYAAYALDAAQKAGVSVPNAVWKTIDKHWRATQQPTDGDAPAGWTLDGRPPGEDNADPPADPPAVLPTAGGVAALSIVDRVLDDDDNARRRAIDKGIAWLDRNFTTQPSDDGIIDWYFGMWSIQQVGRVSGRAQFNGVDWFRDITPLILANQRNGLWYSDAFQVRDDPDPTMPTAMALLYLASALNPVAVARVEHDFGWDDHPRALGAFARYATQRYERDTHWTTTSLDRPLVELLDYPMLFVGATEAVDFTDAKVDKLRDYCHAGGLLILNPSDPKGAVGRSFKRLFDQIAPGRAMATIEPDNPIYAVHREVRPSVRMQAIGSAVRPWAIWCLKDLGEDLADSRGESDALVTLSNLYLYRVGRNPRRTRLTSAYLADTPAPGRTINAARLRHDGDFDPEPVALPQLSRYLAARHDASLRVSTLDPAALSDSTSVAFLTTAGDGALTASQADAIRRWCASGGTLILDAAGGSGEAVAAAEAMLAAIFPDRGPVPVSPRSPILTGRGLPGHAVDRSSVEYRLFTLQQGVLTDRPRLSTVPIDGRDAVVFSAEDLTCGWAGIEHWGINGYTIDDARGLGANAVLSAID